ncbi:MAG: 50S ribosomal protein L6 [Candidatus Thermoplasmatota archaeon]|nr:50S ribosomal protein L6 [Candidatus Thermoplasmatota archaeon]
MCTEGKEILVEELKIPEKVTVELKGNSILVKGPNGTLTKNLKIHKLKLEKAAQSLVLSCEKCRKKERALLYTILAHLKNMLHGVTKGWQYELKIVYSHFPIKATVKGDKFVIENFLGEHSPRVAAIIEGTKVEIKGDKVILTGIDLEKVSQTAANIELATKIKDRDPRVFQDGIYIVKKG